MSTPPKEKTPKGRTALPYQKEFINFMVSSGGLQFGEFTTKSGRQTPYFINTGRFDHGATITMLGRYYAMHVINQRFEGIDVIFGPAYKGVPLAVACTSSLFTDYNKNVGFAFNRKESKEHGEKGAIIGRLEKGDSVLIVEDVVTAGTTLREIIPVLKAFDVEIAGVIVSVDRCERGTSDTSAIVELSKSLEVKISPIVTIYDIIAYLSQENSSGIRLTPELQEKIQAYLKLYGAKSD